MTCINKSILINITRLDKLWPDCLFSRFHFTVFWINSVHLSTTKQLVSLPQWWDVIKDRIILNTVCVGIMQIQSCEIGMYWFEESLLRTNISFRGYIYLFMNKNVYKSIDVCTCVIVTYRKNLRSRWAKNMIHEFSKKRLSLNCHVMLINEQASNKI